MFNKILEEIKYDIYLGIEGNIEILIFIYLQFLKVLVLGLGGLQLIITKGAKRCDLIICKQVGFITKP